MYRYSLLMPGKASSGGRSLREMLDIVAFNARWALPIKNTNPNVGFVMVHELVFRLNGLMITGTDYSELFAKLSTGMIPGHGKKVN